MPDLLLDTCAIFWLAGSEPMEPDAIATIEDSQRREGVFISPISAWEIGTLSRHRGARPPRFLPNDGVAAWFAAFMARPGLRQAPFTTTIAIAASLLPPGLHEDPGDRLLVATARHLGLAIVTRDRKILDYAALGQVQALAC